MVNLSLIIVTLFCAFLVVYHHIGYPLLLTFLTKKKILQSTIQETKKVTTRSERQYEISDSDKNYPSITLVMPAYNEARWVAEKMRNLAALDYPQDRLKVVIGCDGCTDKTYQIAIATSNEPELANLNLSIVNFSINRGKVALLNTLLADINSDLIALTDTSALLSIDALLITATHFKEPKVGVLTGHYRFVSAGSKGEQAYWNYQSKIKASEAALGSTLGAHGAFYVFRGELFTPLASDTINDDFILPMTIVAAGYRADYDSDINALELEKTMAEQDSQRRRRIGAGNLQQLIRLKSMLLPRYKGVSFTFLSGKALRVLMPILMIISLLGCLLLAQSYLFFTVLSALQICAYFAAIYAIIVPSRYSPKMCKLLAYLVNGHFASFIGALRYLLHLDKNRWIKINNQESSS
jgi:cellulose synthase/poly-beta-1,6-N-acetylglucosamine synthase-like glycosyltransferase